MLHIPILRKGVAYRSLDVARVPHHRTREPFVEVSQANVGLIRRELLGQAAMRAALTKFSTDELIRMSERAAGHFAHDTLPLGDTQQSPEDYVAQVSATTGLPFTLARRNMEKIRTALAQTGAVIAGLTRQLDLRVLDDGFAEVNGMAMSFFPRSDTLGVVLPSNSPGVHSLWAPAIAMKIALVLKPGSAEPWTPWRMIQAFVRAGCPPEAFCYFPADHAGGGEILRNCGRGMIFGDTSSLRAWANDPRIELHGPGYSKVVLGDDVADNWEKYLDVMAESIAANSGRSCINASAIWTPRHAEKIAEALAVRLAKILPRAAEDPEAELAPFADASVAQRISAMIDDGLTEPGARDVTAAHRNGPRCVTWNNCTYLLPTIVHCASIEHPLANREFLFPFASVVEASEESMPAAFGPTLVVTAITANPKFIQRLTASPHIGRLNLGPIPTNRVRWDQPHEGNLFDHLYGRRAFQSAAEPQETVAAR
ncbi:MAG TPA: aldehyde dehydrogenase family protein [Candidatus Nitrosotenuis sp.]|nr:aldehyde dehydrogenase family protein [Candidatus Nitrosotenuis sp.]